MTDLEKMACALQPTKGEGGVMVKFLSQLWCGMKGHAGLTNCSRLPAGWWGRCKACGKQVRIAPKERGNG